MKSNQKCSVANSSTKSKMDFDKLMKMTRKRCKIFKPSMNNRNKYGKVEISHHPEQHPPKDPFNVFSSAIPISRPANYTKNTREISCSTISGGYYLSVNNDGYRPVGKQRDEYDLMYLTEALTKTAVTEPIEMNQWNKSWREELFTSMMANFGFSTDEEANKIFPGIDSKLNPKIKGHFKVRVRQKEKEKSLELTFQRTKKKLTRSLLIQISILSNRSFRTTCVYEFRKGNSQMCNGATNVFSYNEKTSTWQSSGVGYAKNACRKVHL